MEISHGCPTMVSTRIWCKYIDIFSIFSCEIYLFWCPHIFLGDYGSVGWERTPFVVEEGTHHLSWGTVLLQCCSCGQIPYNLCQQQNTNVRKTHDFTTLWQLRSRLWHVDGDKWWMVFKLSPSVFGQGKLLWCWIDRWSELFSTFKFPFILVILWITIYGLYMVDK